MKYQIYNVPIPLSDGETENLNRFIGKNRIISVQKELVRTGVNCYWSFLIEYDGHGNTDKHEWKNRVDYKEQLSEENFALYCRLKELRKEVAEKKAVPVYAVFTNEQLAVMASSTIHTAKDMRKIEGIGEKKMESYGEIFYKFLKEDNEKGG